jgi:hypothetical protein
MQFLASLQNSGDSLSYRSHAPFLFKRQLPQKEVSAFADFASFCSESSLLPSKICLRDLLWNLWLDMLDPRGTATVLMPGAFGFALVT